MQPHSGTSEHQPHFQHQHHPQLGSTFDPRLVQGPHPHMLNRDPSAINIPGSSESLAATDVGFIFGEEERRLRMGSQSYPGSAATSPLSRASTHYRTPTSVASVPAPRYHDQQGPPQFRSTPNYMASPTSSEGSSRDSSRHLIKDPSLHYCVENSLAALDSFGFQSIEALADAYYNGKFEESSQLAAEQAISRKRGVPQLLATVLNSSRNWDFRERQRLEEDILKAAETTLRNEEKLHYQALDSQMGELIRAMQEARSTPNESSKAKPAELVGDLKVTLQNTVRLLIPYKFY